MFKNIIVNNIRVLYICWLKLSEVNYYNARNGQSKKEINPYPANVENMVNFGFHGSNFVKGEDVLVYVTKC